MVAANAVADLGTGDFDVMIDDAERLAAQLEERAGAAGPFRDDARELMFDDPGRVMSVNPVIGRCSPIAPPVEMSLRNGEVTGTTTFSRGYVGPPDRVHGGSVCALLDQVLGFACVAGGHPGYTASITVHLRKATPLDTELRFVGRLREVRGRRITAWGALYAGDVVTAEAEGVFVAVPESTRG